MVVELVRDFGADVAKVSKIFESQKDAPAIAKNAPPYAGAVRWVRGLAERITQPFEKISGLNPLVIETDESIEITRQYEALLAQLRAYEAAAVAKWKSETESTSDEAQDEPASARMSASRDARNSACKLRPHAGEAAAR